MIQILTPGVVMNLKMNVENVLMLFQMKKIFYEKEDLPYYMLWQFSELNNTTYELGKCMLLTYSEIDQFKIDRVRYKIWEQGVNEKKKKKQEHF